MPNTQAIKKRIRSIKSTQKITKAMKLVSLSKLQRYRDRKGHFEAYYDAVSHATTQFIDFEVATDNKPKLYFVVMPDLGLCSAYTQGNMRKLLSVYKPEDSAVVIGTQSYESLKNKSVTIVNPMQSSEHFELLDAVKLLKPYLATHQIVTIVPDYANALNLEFELHTLPTVVSGARDQVIYEPNFEDVASIMIQQALMALLRHTYLTSKVSEHTTRRIAMEKATDSAEDMIEDLGRKYNRIRQEAITQEISEIVSGMEG